MLKASLLVVLAALSSVASINTNDFFSEVELVAYEDNDLQGLDYDNLFDAGFTVTVFGTPVETGGGEKDLKKFGKYFLRKFNQVQRKVERKIARKTDSETIKEPGILMFETEIVEQYLSSVADKSQATVWYNMLEIKASLVCVEEECPKALLVDDEEASMLDGTRRELVKAQRRLVSVADKILEKLLKSGRAYFAGATCVRITSSLTTFVDESSGCENYPVVVIKVDEEA